MKDLPLCSRSWVYSSIFLLYFAATARSQCVTCGWSNDGTAFLKWVSKTEGGESYTHVEKCAAQNCGLAIFQSPWLPSSSSQTQFDLQFKVYGYSSVYLKLYFKEEGSEGQPRNLFSKFANYGDSFPSSWSSQKVTIPKTSSRFQLMLKALIPFKDAYVAVKGIELVGGVVVRTSSSTSSTTSTTTTTTTTTRRPTQVVSTASTTTRETNVLEFPNEDDEENAIEVSQALEDGRFIGVEDLTLGHTTVVQPNLCKYN